ncbi:NADH dehydrogenase [Dissulfurispira thermophila]|uniref:NADH dehydrogenase n=1 Tax=Dissulfurispira thermophila TaxID=2715679 RepID=A0A7G1H1Z7_9BACT|nr:NAD(P)H-dependent oxidoreductase subunit E [Dissulfurispira thermophila]BCB96259.1 NADH dehydrogenase [Dissulfurispira thermophila]
MDKVLNKILNDYQKNKGNLIYLLQKIQDTYGYIPEDIVFWFSNRLNIPASKFYGIITFYPKFRLKPTGKNTITVCCGAACHIKGSDRILQEVRSILSLREGEDTTQNLSFTVQKATCIGACNIAPVVILNDQVYGDMDTEKVSKLIKGYEKKDEYTGFEY